MYKEAIQQVKTGGVDPGNLLNVIKKRNILVLGDVMLDTYFLGNVNRISPEAPVPVFRKRGEKSVPGGAANVAQNIIAANQKVSLMALIGKDTAGDLLLRKLDGMDIDDELVIRTERPTSVKTRFLAENNHQVMRMDVEETQEVSHEQCEKLLAILEKQIDQFDLLILSDYAKGMISEEFSRRSIQLARRHGKKVLVDVKGTNAEKYDGAYLIKPNVGELHSLTGMDVDTEEEILAAARKLREICGSAWVLVTRGKHGMLLVGKESKADCECTMSVKADDREVYDVTGAGDTAIAYLAACIANGLPVRQAVKVANHAAGIQVSRMGTSCVGLLEVAAVFQDEGQMEKGQGKILDRAACVYLRSAYAGRKIVFTNGCFDILHVGHVQYLRQAAALGDVLVVGLNSDGSVRRLKGEGRPVNTENERAELLGSLEFVDYVVIFDEDTPYELIGQIQPDILVKASDYKAEEIVGRDIVLARGGRVETLPFVQGKSTTGIIECICKSSRGMHR